MFFLYPVDHLTPPWTCACFEDSLCLCSAPSQTVSVVDNTTVHQTFSSPSCPKDRCVQKWTHCLFVQSVGYFWLDTKNHDSPCHLFSCFLLESVILGLVLAKKSRYCWVVLYLRFGSFCYCSTTYPISADPICEEPRCQHSHRLVLWGLISPTVTLKECSLTVTVSHIPWKSREQGKGWGQNIRNGPESQEQI
jgi:hypothetical protein